MRRNVAIVIVIVALAAPAAADQWQQLSPSTSPPPTHGHTLVTLEDGVYLFGGIANEMASDQLWRWDHDQEAWDRVPQTGAWPAPRGYHDAVEYDGAMIVMGGSGPAGSLDDVWRYEPGDGWTVLPPAKLKIFPTAWHSAVVVFVAGFAASILILGGFVSGSVAGRVLQIIPTLFGFSYVFLQSDSPRIRRYGLIILALLIVAALPLPLERKADGDYPVYAFGGADMSSYSDGLYSIDPETGDVEEVQVSGPKPSPRLGAAVAGWGTQNLIFGGEGPGGVALDDAWKFDLETVSFSRLADMPAPMAGHAAAAIPRIGPGGMLQVLVFGGWTSGQQVTADTYLYTSDVDLEGGPAPDLAFAAAVRAQGLGVLFASRWNIVNLGGSNLQLELVFTPRGGGSADAESTLYTLPPRGMVEIDDPLGEVFGFTGDAVGSVLVTVTEGSPDDLVLQSVITAVQDDGSEYNQFFPAVPYGDGYVGGTTAYLWTTEDPAHNRVNFGVAALDDGTEVRVTPEKPMGTELAPARVLQLDRGGNDQLNNVHGVFGLGGMADVILRMEVVSGRAVGYVSVLDGVGAAYEGTSDPTTVLPVTRGFPRATLLEIGPVVGGNEFSGSGSVTSFATNAVAVRADFFERGSSGVTHTTTFNLAPGETRGFSDIVSDLFGVDSAVGTLDLVAPGNQIAALGREFAIFRDGGGEVVGTAGQPMPGLRYDQQLEPGRTYHVVGLRQSADGRERSHIAFFNPGEQPLTYRVELFSDSGASEGELEDALAGNTLVHVNSIVQVIDPQQDGGVKRLEVTVDRRAFCLGFRVNPTGDPITLPTF